MDGPPIAPALSVRDLDILEAMSRGWSNDTIARELRLSPRTVRNYVSRTYQRLGVDNRVEAVLWWTRIGAAVHGRDRPIGDEDRGP